MCVEYIQIFIYSRHISVNPCLKILSPETDQLRSIAGSSAEPWETDHMLKKRSPHYRTDPNRL